jgi:5-methylcytosine-specific restriction endonuclease McrA
MAAAIGSTKWCPKCKSFMDVSFFTKDKSKRDGLKVWCKSCKAADELARQRRNPKKYNLRVKAWRAKNPERIRELCRGYARRDSVRRAKSSRLWRLKNPEKMRKSRRSWDLAHPTYTLQARTRRRSSGIFCELFTEEDVVRIWRLQQKRCAYCRCRLNPKLIERDHIVPLCLGGDNSRRNLQVTCSRCNRSKGGRHPIEYARRLGLLL